MHENSYEFAYLILNILSILIPQMKESGQQRRPSEHDTER
jgi:hypothetical protein